MQSCIKDDSEILTPVMIQLSDELPLTLIQNFLTERERKHILDVSKTINSQASTVATKGGNAVSDDRTSTSKSIQNPDEVIRCIQERIATYALQPVTHLEPLQLTSYKETQQYRPHFDAFSGNPKNQRTTTLLTFLNDVEDNCGGKTYFPDLDVAVTPTAGDALVWNSLDWKGDIEKKSLHSGCPLTCSSEKHVMNAWFRAHDL